jgi:hypothetical protein
VAEVDVAADGAADVEAVAPWHQEIAEDDFGPVFADLFEPGLPFDGLDHLPAMQLQDFGHQLAIAGIVFDDQYLLHVKAGLGFVLTDPGTGRKAKLADIRAAIMAGAVGPVLPAAAGHGQRMNPVLFAALGRAGSCLRFTFALVLG